MSAKETWNAIHVKIKHLFGSSWLLGCPNAKRKKYLLMGFYSLLVDSWFLLQCHYPNAQKTYWNCQFLVHIQNIILSTETHVSEVQIQKHILPLDQNPRAIWDTQRWEDHKPHGKSAVLWCPHFFSAGVPRSTKSWKLNQRLMPWCHYLRRKSNHENQW